MTPATLDLIRSRPELSNNDFAALLASDYTTVTRINREALAAHLLASGLSSRFRKARESAETHPDIAEALHTLKDIIDSGIREISTDTPDIAFRTYQLLGGLQMAGLLSADEAAGLLALGGGYRYDRLSEKEIDAARRQLAREEAVDALERQIDGLTNSLRGVVDHARRGDDPLPTDAEVRALCADAFPGEG